MEVIERCPTTWTCGQDYDHECELLSPHGGDRVCLCGRQIAQLRPAATGGNVMSDEVWIATEGIYHDREILGVYRTLESAKADLCQERWIERRDGQWWNGLDHGQCVTITRHDVEGT